MEDSLWWKTPFDGRWPLMEDSLWWKTTFWWNLTFDGRRPLMENNFLMEIDLWWKMTFDGRQPSVKKVHIKWFHDTVYCVCFRAMERKLCFLVTPPLKYYVESVPTIFERLTCVTIWHLTFFTLVNHKRHDSYYTEQLTQIIVN